MKTCATCDSGPVEAGEVELRREVAGHVFTATVPAEICRACGENFTEAADLSRFELAVALELLRGGGAGGEVVRFTRKALGLRVAELAEVLGVTSDVLTRWEKDEQPVEPKDLAVLFLLVRDAAVGSTSVRDALKALAQPKPLARSVALTLKLAS